MTEEAIRSLIDSYIVDNQAHGITPAKTRDMMQQMVTYIVELAGSIGIPRIKDILDSGNELDGRYMAVQEAYNAIITNQNGVPSFMIQNDNPTMQGALGEAAVSQLGMNESGTLFYVDGTEGEGKVLTSDADGNITYRDGPSTIVTVYSPIESETTTIDARNEVYGINTFLVCPSLYFHAVSGTMEVTLNFRNYVGDDEIITLYRSGSTDSNMGALGTIPIPPVTIRANADFPVGVFFTVASGTMTYECSATLIKL